MASLKSFVIEGKLAQEGLSTNGAGETRYGVNGTLNGSLPEGLKMKVKVSDKTVQSVRTRGCVARGHRRAGARAAGEIVNE